ncbi:hypothetical protein Tco_1029622 [Tanacetum coccineum]|uniref:Uncharacterized protein n=1 Tax=Tanacetum coccineum TaxID=301880 RepID=A0ABQ5G3Y6_9ASTR
MFKLIGIQTLKIVLLMRPAKEETDPNLHVNANAENVHADRRTNAQSSPFNAACQIGKLILTSMAIVTHGTADARFTFSTRETKLLATHAQNSHPTKKNQIPARYQLKCSTSNAKISPSTRKGSGDFAVDNILDKPDKPALGQTTSSGEKKGLRIIATTSKINPGHEDKGKMIIAEPDIPAVGDLTSTDSNKTIEVIVYHYIGRVRAISGVYTFGDATTQRKHRRIIDIENLRPEQLPDTTPFLIVNNQPYEDLNQERKRNHFPLATLLEVNPHNYQRVRFTADTTIYRINTQKERYYQKCTTCGRYWFTTKVDGILEDLATKRNLSKIVVGNQWENFCGKSMGNNCAKSVAKKVGYMWKMVARKCGKSVGKCLYGLLRMLRRRQSLLTPNIPKAKLLHVRTLVPSGGKEQPVKSSWSPQEARSSQSGVASPLRRQGAASQERMVHNKYLEHEDNFDPEDKV